jgi:molybdopterin-binding protein
VTGVVRLHGVQRRYAGGFVLQIPELEVHAGEILAVLGPNGSGKSALLRALGLLEVPDSGRVLLHGRPVDARAALAERRRMATVFQEPLLADTSVADNVALGLRFRGVAASDIEPRVARWLERFGVSALASRAARTLSGGEAQRVALARALVLEPEVLLLDEPFASLDQPSRTALIADLGSILRQDHITTVLVTHHRGEAQALADRVAVLIGGRIRQLDETARVFQAPVSEDVARFVGAETIVTAHVLGREAGVTRAEVAGRTLAIAVPADIGARVRLAILPEDVTLARSRESAGVASTRNELAGPVARITVTDTGVRVVVDCGFLLVAAVTTRALAELQLIEGMEVLALVESSAVHVIREPAALDTPAAPGL